jgi:hypothetical protein
MGIPCRAVGIVWERMLGPIRGASGELSAAAAADLYARSRYSRHDEAAGGLPNGPLFRRILGRAHSATPPCVLGSSRNRQRRGVGSRFLRFLVARPGSVSRHLYSPIRRQHLRRARWGLEIGARAGKLYRCFPRSGVVAMNLAQSNEPDQPVLSTVSITVLSVTPARAKKLRLRRNRHRRRADRSSRHPRDEGGRGDGDRAAQISRCRRRVANGDHPAGRSSLADRQGSVRRSSSGAWPSDARSDDRWMPQSKLKSA